jgi:hypothetical protein
VLNCVCTNPYSCGSRSNTSTCRGNCDPCPSYSNTNVVRRDSCSSNGDADTANTRSYPINTNADGAHPYTFATYRYTKAH